MIAKAEQAVARPVQGKYPSYTGQMGRGRVKETDETGVEGGIEDQGGVVERG